jgi:hypothetical protein|tara:strand:- start:1738 stop:1920 length:183 start_codon:yes stop_codon:yes gene_type:complete
MHLTSKLPKLPLMITELWESKYSSFSTQERIGFMTNDWFNKLGSGNFGWSFNFNFKYPFK